MTGPRAVLFGSIGTLAETSELQRQSFNQAFAVHGLTWFWDQRTYQALLRTPGGQNRIAAYAVQAGDHVDADLVHRSKSKIYQALLTRTRLAPRKGVMETLAWARQSGLRTALVSTTSRQNIDHIIGALHPTLEPRDFDVICDGGCVEAAKPAPDIYRFALELLGVDAPDTVAIEDTQASLDAALAAGVPAIAFPGANARTDLFAGAVRTTSEITPAHITAARQPQTAAVA